MKGRALSLVVSLLLAATTLPAATGIVFIHGKGSNALKNLSDASEYWGVEMIRATTKNRAIPHLVCHYDGTKSMWAAAEKVAEEVNEWLGRDENKNITDLIVVTHSFGGVVIRRILSNSDRFPFAAKILWVDSIAAPNRGSEAADLARTLSSRRFTGWIVNLAGENNDATKNCSTDVMRHYNEYYLAGTSSRRPLPRQLFHIAGVDVRNDGHHAEDKGLLLLSEFASFPAENDGMVAEYSARAVGSFKLRTQANHHHNRRNDYRQIGDYLASSY